jgi:hypothetical protein
MGCCMTVRLDTAPSDARRQCSEQNRKVSTQRNAVDVFDIEVDLVFPTNFVSPADLGQPGDPRLGRVTARLIRCVAVEVAHQERPGTGRSAVAATAALRPIVRIRSP